MKENYHHIVYRIILVLNCFILHSTNSNAQNIQFTQLGPEDGLSQLTVNTIYQDAKGYLWFGTQDGLNRYDGYEFKHFEHEPSNPNSLSHSWIWNIHEDRNKNLWVATWSGLNKISPDKNRIKRYFPNPKKPGNIRGERPVAISETSDGKLWIACWGGGLNKYDPETDSFSYYSKVLNPDKNLPGDFIRTLQIDSKETLWVGTWSGLWKVDSKVEQFPVFEYIDLGIPKNETRITSVLESHSGNIWIGTLGGGVFIISAKDGHIEHFTQNAIGKYRIPVNQVTGITEDLSGHMWIGTVSGGIIILNPKTGFYTQLISDENNPASLGGNNINSLFTDRSGLIWIGNMGLSIYNPFQNKFNLYSDYQPLIRAMDGIKDISAIAQDKNNKIWIGTPGNGLFCLISKSYNKDTEWIHALPSSLNKLNISSIVTGKGNEIWVGTRGNGLLRLAPEKPNLVNSIEVPGIPSTHGMNFINGLAFIPPNSLWIATYEKGLIHYNTNNKSIEKFMFSEGDTTSFPANYLLRIFKDKSDKLWICTWGAGIIHFDPQNLSWKTYTYIPDDTGSLSDNIPHSVCETFSGDKHRIWIGTRKGLSCLNIDKPDSPVFENYYPSDGLPGNVINSILEDNNHKLWISTNSGLSWFNPDSREFKNYEVHDGLQGNEFNAGAGIVMNDGRIMFGGVKGFNIFHPDSISESSYQPEIVINSLKVFNDEIPINPYNLEVKLNYQENFLAFEFSSLDFSKPMKNQYKYMMEGIDPDWVIAGKRRYASYTDIKPGDYNFLVMGTNSDGVWNEIPASFRVQITPPYWQTWWFRTLVGLVLIAFARLILTYRIRKMREIEKLRLRIASDLHDDIGSSLTHITIHSQLAGEKINNPKALSSLEKIAELSREVISTMSDIVWSIDARNDNISDMLDRMRDFAYSSLAEKDISVRFKQKGLDRNKKMDVLFRQNLFSIYKEAVNNILKHSGATEVNIVLVNSYKDFKMKIRDNGSGFDQEGIRKGNGLQNMKMRANRLGGNLDIINSEGTTILLKTKNL